MGQVSDFHENTTKIFNGVITQNGLNPNTSGDVVRFMMKKKKNDIDSLAVVNVIATGLGVGGTFTITLTSAVTKDIKGNYYYEILWFPDSGTDNYHLDSGKIKVLNKLQDNV